jgi:hypothetical protein
VERLEVGRTPKGHASARRIGRSNGSKDGVDICAGFIYFTNSKTAWIEFIVSNFNYKEKDRKQALEFLISSLVDITRDVNKCKYIYTSLKSSSLIKRYENCGFKSGSTSCTEMIMVI